MKEHLFRAYILPENSTNTVLKQELMPCNLMFSITLIKLCCLNKDNIKYEYLIIYSSVPIISRGWWYN